MIVNLLLSSTFFYVALFYETQMKYPANISTEFSLHSHYKFRIGVLCTGFQVFIVVSVQAATFRAPRSIIGKYQRFSGMCCLLFHDRSKE
jgi:hypothetical protein